MPSSKNTITNSQKEERKRKLKEIASKVKDADIDNCDKKLGSNISKSVTHVKITTSNRGAFLTDDAAAGDKSISNKDKDSSRKQKKKSSSRTHSKSSKSTKKDDKNDLDKKSTENIKNHKLDDEKRNSSQVRSETKEDKEPQKETKSKLHSSSNKPIKSSPAPIPLKNLKPLTNSTESQPNKPCSKVQPLPISKKPKKQVRFSNCPDEVFEFEIEPGNIMTKTSSVKTRLVDARKMQMKIFSLEKTTLMKILRWNPQWLDVQKSNVDPPPILDHDNPPMAIFHNFNSHSQYVGYVLFHIN